MASTIEPPVDRSGPDAVDLDLPEESKMTKLASASVLATALEWFDFLIYSTASALVFGHIFFPSLDGALGTIASFGTLAVGFIARPVGGIIAGALGDRFGRKGPLVASMVIMGLATASIGLLPGYETIGIWAPILLITARLIQGLGVGAQWGGATLLLTEHSPIKRRGFYGSLVQLGTVAGIIIGNAFFLCILLFVDEDAFIAWGWRVPFLSGLILVAVGIFVQMKIEETPVFKSMQAKAQAETAGKEMPKVSLLGAVRRYWRQILQAAGAFFVVNGTFYVMISGMLSYGTANVGLSQTTMIITVCLAVATQIFTIPYFGAWSDRHGRRKIFLVGTVLMAVWAFPFFWLVDTGNPVLVALSLIVGLTLHAMMFGPQAALFAEMFPADVRYFGASLGFQLASVFAGGLAPMIMVSLIEFTGTSASVSAYIIVMAVITFIAVYTIKERFQANLHETTRDIEEREASEAAGVEHV
ncbi:MFS transporter [Brevibacterium sp. UCMA 11752]|uniref:MFS transporter n=1 Tax=Brevibacterium sp. UCMA 11752 TaxID=2745946 RepID=UPI001F2E2D96|nr:MFS transporter [Brevibacterium sp. UCMA 11752]MCF2589258.1 MHS family MFS transporter [Brevibacterium sp. UCMA 11752]